MTADQWISSFATRIGVEPPSSEEIDQILGLAGVAAHASERTAAPVACWIAAKSGRPLEDARQIAKEVL